jgi:hypothetical protein
MTAQEEPEFVSGLDGDDLVVPTMRNISLEQMIARDLEFW